MDGCLSLKSMPGETYAEEAPVLTLFKRAVQSGELANAQAIQANLAFAALHLYILFQAGIFC